MGSDHDGVQILPRGGVLLPSSIGNIQYGAVPETIKDTMESAAGVPTVFVVPQQLFSHERGILLAEMEFPAFWNYFVKGKRTTIVCRPEQLEVMQAVLSEALFGPRRMDPDEFARPPAQAPDLPREFSYFRNNPKTGKPMQLDDLIEWKTFGADGKATVTDGVQVAVEAGGGAEALALLEGGRARLRYRGSPPLPSLRTSSGERDLRFRPPILGVSVIGSGHGFDPGNRTSGFVVWIDGNGVMVDPPVDSLEWLAGYEIHPRQINSLILTHCHADHDAGTLQKILQEGRITIYTTPTVLSSFVSKYSRLVGMDKAAFSRLFDFVPVRAGVPLTIHGATVTFRYSLHSVPCVGFEIEHRGKSLVYPSDTLNDPQAIRALRDQGVMSQERARDLVEFPWHHQLVLHEAGVPPIHTPVKFLASLEDAVKQRMLLVHVSERTLPADSGLRVAPTGLENTLDLGAPRLEIDETLEALDTMARVEILSTLPAARAADFVRCVRRDSFKAGERVVSQGTSGDRFYVILTGKAAIFKEGREFKVYSCYDYFGETALVTGEPRTADVFAKTDLTTLSLAGPDFLQLIHDTGLADQLRHLAEVRALPTWEFLSASPLFSNLTANQKTQLQTLMSPVMLEEGQLLELDPLLVEHGSVEVRHLGKWMGDVEALGFAGDAAAVRSQSVSPYSFRCVTDVHGYLLKASALRSFFRKNPGVYIRLASLFSHD